MLSSRMTFADCFRNVIVAVFVLWKLSTSQVVNASPIEVQEYPGIDACSAYLPKVVLDTSERLGIEVIALNSSSSLRECTEEAVDWSDPSGKRCQTACWYENAPTESIAKNECLCLVDPIWMPRPAINKEQVSSSRLIWSCHNDQDCSYNGRCSIEDGRCQCTDAWKGPTCGEVDLLPVDKTKLGFRQVDDHGSNISSWGAPILWDEDSQLWHGFASEIQAYCGINAWETNSRIVHITGNSPHGPFQRRKVVFESFSHEPSVVRDPTTGEWVMLFSSYHYNATTLDEVLCKSCKDGVTPEISPKCPYQLGTPKNLHHPFQQMMSTAQSPFGPWSSPVEIPQLSTGWDWNTDVTINNDGSAVALIRGGTTVYASNYKDPSTWKIDKGLLQYKGWDGASVEDPYIWQQDGVYHALAHAFLPFYGVHAYAPFPTSHETLLKWTVTGVAYDNIVHFTDGTSHAYARRERPHLLWGPSGKIVALSNGVQFDGKLRQEYKDGCFTLVQPVRTNNNPTATS